MKKLGNLLAVLLCKKKTVLVCLPGESLESALPTSSGYTPPWLLPCCYCPLRKTSGSSALLFLFMFISPAAGYRQRLREHMGQSFCPLGRKKKGRKTYTSQLWGPLDAAAGWCKLHESQRRAEGSHSESTPSSGPSLLGDWSIEGLLSSQVKTQDKPLALFALGHMDSSSPSLWLLDEPTTRWELSSSHAPQTWLADPWSWLPGLRLVSINGAQTEPQCWCRAGVHPPPEPLVHSSSAQWFSSIFFTAAPEAGDSLEKENEGTQA